MTLLAMIAGALILAAVAVVLVFAVALALVDHVATPALRDLIAWTKAIPPRDGRPDR